MARVVAAAPGLRCAVKIRLGPAWSIAQRDRVARARRLGCLPDDCTRDATHTVDGVPMCRRHAGEAAIRVLQEMDS